MLKIVADDKIPFLKGIFEPYAEILYLPDNEINRSLLKEVDAIIIRTRTKCTADLLEGTKVRFIGTATIGFDHIDRQYCERKNIFWTNAPGCNSASVQQYIGAALLTIAASNGFNLSDKTLGIIGVGNVGSEIERFAKLIGMKVLLNDPPRERREGKDKFVNLGQVLYDSDIITLHVPLNVVGSDITYHLFKEKSFKKMKKGTWFINTSRGEVVDTIALKRALESGKLGGVVLDVWENEPDIDLELMSETYISTPHIAGYSADGKANGTSIIVNTLSEFFGIPLKNWYPGNIPAPAKTVINIDGRGKSTEVIVREAVTRTYDIIGDSNRLRNSPGSFEKLREHYNLRREFPSYSVRVKNCREEDRNILRNMGFKV